MNESRLERMIKSKIAQLYSLHYARNDSRKGLLFYSRDKKVIINAIVNNLRMNEKGLIYLFLYNMKIDAT